jgi:hypothetical protein
MIDTIVIRLHNLEKYKNLIDQLRLKKSKGYKLKTAIVDVNEIKRIRDAGYDEQRTLEIYETNRPHDFLIKTEVGKQVNASHHYAFTYRINESSDYVEFNFSIPKYLFGSNIIMFVEHFYDRYYSLYENGTFEYNVKKAPDYFMSFIRYFFKREFFQREIDYRDVEINRIDVCFSQVFSSKEEALRYLSYQKKIRKKYSRDEDGGKSEWNTSFMYTTKRSSSKIYHKGTEYKKHDRKEHEKINRERGDQYFDTRKYQEFADRILRYEVTLRSAELNYLFKHNIFRKHCPYFAVEYKNFMRVDNIKQRNDRISKVIGKLPNSEKAAYKRLHPYERVTKEDNQRHRIVARLMNRKPLFMMEIDSREEKYNKQTVNYESHSALFNKELLRLGLQKLQNFINEFKIEELPNAERVGLLIDIYNSKNKSKIQKSDMIHFYSYLVKHGSFKEAAEFGGYGRASLYRYKQRFKKIGITENHIFPDVSISIPKQSIDFKIITIIYLPRLFSKN